VCSVTVWVLYGLPYKGACEDCLVDTELHNKAFLFMEGVGNSLNIREYLKEYYKCPTCEQEKYVIKGLYKGECA
jgi:hypothetical protein